MERACLEWKGKQRGVVGAPHFFAFPSPRYPLTGPVPDQTELTFAKTPTTCRITVLVLPFIWITFVLIARCGYSGSCSFDIMGSVARR
ncbi:hypothetical protein CEXT_259371 [Caerostris extrusa]|uniref:Uncharacterized protein n=1 Tax=Caerostris extrusa TaxID=172846 RepID=A0AAV4M540_CAEEX|nr:hypothetical protein CEXT_259371 [Caerostris extrusa]